MFEYLKRSLGGSTAAAGDRAIARSSASSGKGRDSCQKSLSGLSRNIPLE